MVLLVLLTTVMGSGAMFSLYTYVAPSLETFTHASATMITLMLILIGIGFSLGNHLSSKFADRSVDKTLIVFLAVLIVVMLAFPILAKTAVDAGMALVIWGVAAFGIVPPLQMRVMAVAHKAQDLVSSVNIGAFNLGNALGAMVGGLVLSLNLGYGAVAIVGAVMAGLSLLLVVGQMIWTKRNPNLFIA